MFSGARKICTVNSTLNIAKRRLNRVSFFVLLNLHYPKAPFFKRELSAKLTEGFNLFFYLFFIPQLKASLF